MKLVQAQVSHANILSIDTSEAETMPGVYKIITYKDVPGTNRINGTAASGKADGKDRPILSDKKILQSGDAIAAVLAFKPKLAEEAAKKVKVKIEELPDSESAVKEEKLSFEPEVGFAYLNEKGKLMIHTKSTDAHLRQLAEGIGISSEKLAIVPNPTVGTGGYKSSPAMEGLLGVAALVAKNRFTSNCKQQKLSYQR